MLKSYIAFDVETTGLNPVQDEIIEIGALKVREGRVAERFMNSSDFIFYFLLCIRADRNY